MYSLLTERYNDAQLAANIERQQWAHMLPLDESGHCERRQSPVLHRVTDLECSQL